MKHFSAIFLAVTTIVCACNPLPGPRNLNWEKEWSKNEKALKDLTADIIKQGNKKYAAGNNNFPSDFRYPFDEGFHIETPFSTDSNHLSQRIDTIDVKRLTINFFIDRGLLDHYAAIVFSNDPGTLEALERSVGNEGNDFRIEPNWYMVRE
jgi:hypothetical protein